MYEGQENFWVQFIKTTEEFYSSKSRWDHGQAGFTYDSSPEVSKGITKTKYQNQMKINPDFTFIVRG